MRKGTHSWVRGERRHAEQKQTNAGNASQLHEIKRRTKQSALSTHRTLSTRHDRVRRNLQKCISARTSSASFWLLAHAAAASECTKWQTYEIATSTLPPNKVHHNFEYRMSARRAAIKCIRIVNIIIIQKTANTSSPSQMHRTVARWQTWKKQQKAATNIQNCEFYARSAIILNNFTAISQFDVVSRYF